MVVTLERDAVVLQLIGQSLTVVRLVFVDASPDAVVDGGVPVQVVFNFLTGSDPANWRSGVQGYSEAIYRGLWDGIDVRVRDDRGRLKYDVLVAPGADLESVVIRGEGLTGIAVEPDGALAMRLPSGGEIHQPPPTTWQEDADKARRAVACRYRIVDAVSYGFEVAERGDGRTYDPTFNGYRDGYVLRLSPDGNGADDLIYSTFLGGYSDDRGHAVAMDDTQGNGRLSRAIVGGYTMSSGFPTTPGAYQTTALQEGDAFVCRIGPLWPVDPTSVVLDSPGHSGSVAEVRLGGVQPNPVRNLLLYEVDVQDEARVRVGIYDAHGRLVARLRDQRLTPGLHDFVWVPEVALPRGTYFLRLDSGSAHDSRRIVLVP